MPPIYLAPFFPHSQLKMWGNGAKQMGKHSTGFIPQCGLTLLILLIQVQLKLFSSCFLFFPPVESALISFRASFQRRTLLLEGGSKASPFNPQCT